MEISKTKASVLATLGQRKMRRKYGLFMAEGDKCVRDTLGTFETDCIVATRRWLADNADCKELSDITLLEASTEVMKKISSLSTAPEVVAVFKLPAEGESQFILEKGKLHLLLDGIQDPGNLGTIIRTADWFGFDRIYVSPDTVDVYNPKTIQATMGSLRRVKVIVADLDDLIIRSGDMHVYGLMLDGQPMSGADLANEGVIVMGNEGNGISAPIRELVTDKLLIEPYCKESHAESLNVAIATGITLAAFRKSI